MLSLGRSSLPMPMDLSAQALTRWAVGASQSKVSRDEWISEQQAREEANDIPPIQSAQITQMSREPGSFRLTVELTHDDGTKTTVSGVKVQSVGGSFRRHLTREALIDGAPL